MSLRRRLFTLLIVSCVALAASVLAMGRLVSVSAAFTERSAAAVGQRAMFALAHHLDEGLPHESAATDAVIEDLSRTLEDGTVGICTPDGNIGARRTTVGPARRSDDDGMLPLDWDHVVAACRSASAHSQTFRVLAPTDVLSISVLRTREGTGPVAFALARVPRTPDRGSTSMIALIAFAGATAALLIGLTAHGAWILRASTSSLRASVDALKRDLRAPVADPRAEELSDVAQHLRTLASTLADTQEREHALTESVEEQKRLAGLGRVVAGVAHEVRNPLAGIKLRLDSMALRQLDDRTRIDIEKCLREVRRLDRLVHALLLASKKRAVTRESFDAGAMVAERVSLVAPLAELGDVRIEVEGDGIAIGERESLCGVLDNLLRNAIEASPRGALVKVVVRTEDEGIRVDVVDHGPGIPADRASELFEPFFTTKGSGTGLGLVLARATIEAHGGTLRYERANDTTLFSATIPNGRENESNHG